MMTAKTFADTCRRIAEQYKTCYVWGAVGMPVNANTVADKLAQYPAQNQVYCARAKELIGKDYWMFDCVNLAKAVLWGWCGNRNAYYGGAKYCSNGVPDVSADGMIARCPDTTTNFGSIAVGEALWLPGHFGVYIGNGLGVECTPAWKNGVQITAVGNIGAKSGYPTRTWKKHGKLPYVDYTGAKADENKTGKIIVDGVTYPVDVVLINGTNYIKVRDLAAILGLKVSNKGSIAVLNTK